VTRVGVRLGLASVAVGVSLAADRRSAAIGSGIPAWPDASLLSETTAFLSSGALAGQHGTLCRCELGHRLTG